MIWTKFNFVSKCVPMSNMGTREATRYLRVAPVSSDQLGIAGVGYGRQWQTAKLVFGG
jgi:hypothetical protein